MSTSGTTAKLAWRAFRDAPRGRDLKASWGMASAIVSDLLDLLSPDDLCFSSPEVRSVEVRRWGAGRFVTRIWSSAHVTLDCMGPRMAYDVHVGLAKFELVCRLVDGQLYATKLAGFVDREYRESAMMSGSMICGVGTIAMDASFVLGDTL